MGKYHVKVHHPLAGGCPASGHPWLSATGNFIVKERLNLNQLSNTVQSRFQQIDESYKANVFLNWNKNNHCSPLYSNISSPKFLFEEFIQEFPINKPETCEWLLCCCKSIDKIINYTASNDFQFQELLILVKLTVIISLLMLDFSVSIRILYMHDNWRIFIFESGNFVSNFNFHELFFRSWNISRLTGGSVC